MLPGVSRGLWRIAGFGRQDKTISYMEGRDALGPSIWLKTSNHRRSQDGR